MPQNPNAEEYLPLLRTQRNKAFEWTEQMGFDGQAFTVDEAEWGDTKVTRFLYRDSPYFLDMSTVRGAFSIRFSPGASELLTHQMDYSRDFDAVERPFKAWLSYLRREVEAPDLWALAREGLTLFAVSGEPGRNDPFTAAEQANIAVAIERVRAYLMRAGVSGEPLAAANGKLDYLVEASRRSGRFDWANIAFSVVFNIGLAVAFGPVQARALLEAFMSGVRQLAGG